jgi:hypothetical protein
MLSTADQTTPTDKTTEVDHVDHEIVIIVKNGFASRLKPMPELHFGQTVRYTTPDAKHKASMGFPNLSPYRTDDQTNTEVPGLQIIKLVKEGTFEGKCFITLETGEKIGWNPNDPESGGGIHHVARP